MPARAPIGAGRARARSRTRVRPRRLKPAPASGTATVIFAGHWKAYEELLALGWVENRPPRLFAVQASGVAPIVRAWNNRLTRPEAWSKITTRIPGFMVSNPRAGSRVLQVLRESNGGAIAIEDEAMLRMASRVAAQEGLSISPEGAAAIVASAELKQKGIIHEDDRVVAINTAYF